MFPVRKPKLLGDGISEQQIEQERFNYFFLILKVISYNCITHYVDNQQVKPC